MPKEVVNYTNLLTAKCPKSHLSIPDPIELWEILEGMTVQKIKKFRGKDKIIIFRKKTIEKRGNFVQKYIKKIVSFLEEKNLNQPK